MSCATESVNRLTARGLWWGTILVLLAGWGLLRTAPGAAQQAQASADAPQEIAVPLKEVPVWEVTNPRVRESFLRGQGARVQKDSRMPGKYPEFTSDSPLFGVLSFPRATPDPRKPFRILFALDSSVKGGDYNLLYFDDNQDTDLTNDKLRRPAPKSDDMARRSPSIKETFFEPVQVTFPSGPDSPQTVELLPCLRVYQGIEPQFSFIAARVHTGTFELGGVSYQAFVGYQYDIGGRLDQPSTALILASQGGEPATRSSVSQLGDTHLLGDRYCRFACTPAGDKLTVLPYTGPLGVVEIGQAGRSTGTLTMRGVLRSATTSVPIGSEPSPGRPPEASRSCKLPVGDYRIDNLSVQIDGLFALVLSNYHEDGKPMGKSSGRNTYGIAVREDKPCVLELSRQGQVLFALPPKDQHVRLGEELNIKAVLIDPAFDVMFRILQRQGSLDPKVVIKRSNGEIVAEATMPFG